MQSHTSPEAGRLAAVAGPRSPCIVLAFVDPSGADRLAALLATWGVRAVIESDPSGVCERVDTVRPALIVTDLLMQPLDRVTLARLLERTRRYPMVIRAPARTEAAMQAMAAQIMRFVQAPGAPLSVAAG